jgi:hypothetical protein
MFSTDNETENYYFSGQGVVLLGQRDANGNAAGLLPLGDCSALQIAVNTTVVNHKGSQDGQRAVDARLQTETTATATITIDNWSAQNLATGLRGKETKITAGNVTAETFNGYPGKVSPLQHVSVSNLVLTSGAQALTAYTDAATPWDFQANLSAGSVKLNDGSSGVLPVNLGTTATAITVGATTAITVPNSAAVGDLVLLFGFSGADAGVLNGQLLELTAASGTAVTVAIDTTSKTITVGAGSKVLFLNSAIALSAAYDYATQYLVDALTVPLESLFLRFEGLNTLDSNNPVIVEIPKFSHDPLKELALLTDTFAQVQVEGSVLADQLQPAGSSKYFRIKKLN